MTPIDRLAADYWDRYLEASPTTATVIGDRRFDHLLDDISPPATAELLSQLRRIRAEAEGMHEGDLDQQGRITRAMLMSETLAGLDMIETGILYGQLRPRRRMPPHCSSVTDRCRVFLIRPWNAISRSSAVDAPPRHRTSRGS
jgi:hypothetical protein